MDSSNISDDLNFSKLETLYLKSINVSFEEIKSVIANTNSHLFSISQNEFLVIGFSNKLKFINVLLELSNEIEKFVYVTNVELSNEDQIRKYYCGK
jgi:hypothetical protein